MVHLRSGKITNYDSSMQACGHDCCTLLNSKCCACEDTRPVKTHYVAENRPNMFEPAYVSRSYYYCQACKKTTPPVKIDFSKMKRKPASDPALFRPTPSPKPSLEQRVELMKMLNQELRKMHESSQDTVKGLRTEIELLEAELDEMHDRLKGAVESIKYLTERIRDQFKIPSPM